ncbi:hypothetical protein PG991_015947 [Apiospora marii]|uniref:Uncharacterized protein n=1 Tax=Apiospora marii TaxID=335849 RepID=A0ABR1R043_9PEZI
MHQLRDTLLSSSPQGPPELTMLDSQALDRQDVRECVARGELEELRGAAFHNRTWIVTERYCSGDGVDSLVGYLHSLWHMYYQLARHTSHATTDHDRLVLDVVRIQGLGPLTRPVAGNYGIDIARTVEGTLWNDLPFLATDMTGFWIESCATMSGAQRLNLASFLAKLASTRVGKDRLCQVALVLFRATFEERGPDLCILDQAEDAEDTRRSIRDLSIAQLLPSVCAWIKEAGHNLVLLSDVYWNDCPSAIAQGGEIFTESEWMYWLKRLHEIKQEAKQANETRLEEQASEAIERMSKNAKERNSGIVRAYRSGGEVLRNDKHLSCLGDDSTAGGDESTTGGDEAE